VIDGECALCNRVAHVIDRHDPSAGISIATSQSAYGADLMRKYGLTPSDPTSWLFIEDGVAHKEMDGVIAISRHLKGMPRLLAAMSWIPAPLRNALYRAVAKNRYRLFGRADLCETPSASLRQRIVDT